jgi:Ca2+-binding RTX toxin-like protein
MAFKLWTGLNGTDYTNGNNWNPLGAPGSGDTAIFASGATSETVDIPAGPVLAVDEWLFTGGAYTVNIATTVDLVGHGIEVTAGSESISVLSSGDLVFQNHSSAGNATIAELPGGLITFTGNSDGGTARLITDNSTVDFSGSSGPLGDSKVSLGSIEGVGLFNLGSNQLTVGSNNLSTTVFGGFRGIGGSLVKVGSGTLTLWSSAPGRITLDGGTLDIATSFAVPNALDFGAGGQATLRLESTALRDNYIYDGNISAFGFGDTIDLPGLPFVPGATTFYRDGTGIGVNSGSDAVVLVYFGATGSHYAVLGDHTGGCRLMLAIVEYADHKLVDARHHPRDQPAPTNGPDVIVALGANDTIKGLGGDDSLVGRARGAVLYGGPGADSFIFQEVTASPPRHPDIIMDFHHRQHDKIDLYDMRGFVPGHEALVYIGGQTFAHYHHLHPTVFGMVRYAGGEVRVNFDHHLANEFAIVMYGAPALHAGDFIL